MGSFLNLRLKKVPISVVIFLLFSFPAHWLFAAGASATNKPELQKFEKASALKISQAAIGHETSDYVFYDRQDQKIQLSSYRGKPLIISLIFTSCHHICPTTTQNLAKVVELAQEVLGTDSFNIVSIGFDTHNDTPAAMRNFAIQQGVDEIPGWEFLSADATTIDALTRELGFQFFPSAGGFDHLIQSSLIDANGAVYRQVYGVKFNTPLLVDPLKELVFGRPVKGSLITSINNRIRLFCTVYDPATGRYYFDYSLFVGMFIGLIILISITVWLIREWRQPDTRNQQKSSSNT